MEDIIKIETDVNWTLCSLYYLSKTYNVNFNSLLTLYEMFGNKVFYFYYIHCNRRLIFPSEDKLLDIMKQGELLNSKLKGRSIELKTEKLKSAFDLLEGCMKNDKFEFNINDPFTKMDDLVEGINLEIV